MLGNVGEKVGVAVLSAVILGLLALIWQLVTDGGLVHALGGVTRDDLQARLDEVPSVGVPSGAVVAFDVTGRCPDGWSPFAAGQGRVIVGASFGIGPEPGLGNNGVGQPLVEYKYREHGGVEAVGLTENQIPPHAHDVLYQGSNVVTLDDTPFLGGGENRYLMKPETYVAGQGNTRSRFTAMPREGETAAHENRPPFLALYFCKKD